MNGAPPRRPQRPRELQDGLNHYLYHPLAWQLARLLARTPLTPNMVSVIGGCFVIAAAVVYSQPIWLGLAWPAAPLLGLILHMTWHVVDGADGDLARLTGRSSPVGEMVDGLCDYASHVVMYLTLGWLLAHAMAPESYPLSHPYLWMWAAGISHIIQSNHVEVQRRQYQWWVYGTTWIRMNHGADSATGKSLFGGIVSFYLALASGMTPHALKIDEAVAAAKDDPARLAQIREAVRAEAPPLLRLCKILGPNPRAIVLGLSMLAGGPFWYFVYQSILLNLLLVVSVVAHNRAAQRIAAGISA
ncbi:CDP-alcohol phosphatidyltransferase family protein [Novosphingobium flavum]|uniref:CDP-alcohol phosphatidyltransferase family protein n=2 Tax=Novosphingobium flavum TaxID=1778672 RepID=A0A7X1KKK3_9SPHN|nr:CDP-alcohol phosphatidyltransferase family protein [Novosphingobium flavum]